MFETTTICAISTPPGTGGIGIVRMSGSAAISISKQMFRSNSGRDLAGLQGYAGTLGRIFDDAGDIDDAIAFVYRAPRSYTGEDVVELSCHGGSWLLGRVLELCMRHGALPAAPGEFTKRAFLNGKMALSDAEAVMDLIHAQGDAAARAALAARDGALSTAMDVLVEKIMAPSAHMAAWADYPEEDLEAVESETLATALESVLEEIRTLLGTSNRGKLIREGVDTAIVGRPNVGKSTLMNLLAGEQRSIVTEVPGTTRDVVEDSVRVGDCVLRLADTAGIRETADLVERIGVDRARERMECAALILAVFDSSDCLGTDDRDLLIKVRGRPCIAVINKIDLPTKLDLQEIRESVADLVLVSAQSGEGRTELEAAIGRLLQLNTFDPTAAMVATQRQQQCLQRAEAAITDAVQTLRSGMMLDVVGVLLESALDELLSLTGRKATDAVVDEVFSKFCVGK